MPKKIRNIRPVENIFGFRRSNSGMLNCAWWMAVMIKPSAYTTPMNSAVNFPMNSNRAVMEDGVGAASGLVGAAVDIQYLAEPSVESTRTPCQSFAKLG